MQPPNTLPSYTPPYIPPTPKTSNGFVRFLTTKRAMPTWLLILICFGCLGLGNAAGGPQNTSAAPSAITTNNNPSSNNTRATATNVSTPTDTPLPPTATSRPKPTTITSFSGNTSKHTANFTVKVQQWTIKWACQGGAYGGNFSFGVYNADGSDVDSLAANVVCNGNMSDSTIERGAGEFYISVDADITWQISITAIQ